MKQIILEHKDRYEFYDLVSETIQKTNHDDKCIISVTTFFDELAETNVSIINFRE
jgi:hypothetical protein